VFSARGSRGVIIRRFSTELFPELSSPTWGGCHPSSMAVSTGAASRASILAARSFLYLRTAASIFTFGSSFESAFPN
jgi:hypothetical protein